MAIKSEYLLRLAGETVQEYKVEEKIWQGATSTVYRCNSINGSGRYGGVVAIKVLHPYRNETAQIKLFAREAKLQRKLLHENIVKVFSVTRKGSFYIMFMEYINGCSLKIKSRDIATEQLFTLFIKLARTLDYVHSRGIIHNDIKPENIIIGNNGSVLKLTDFGYAEKYRMRSAGRKNSVGGTEQYMAPERMTGVYDYRSDIYSFGIVLEELLQNRFPSESMYLLISKITQKDSSRRYGSMADVVNALERLHAEYRAANENRDNFGYSRQS